MHQFGYAKSAELMMQKHRFPRRADRLSGVEVLESRRLLIADLTGSVMVTPAFDTLVPGDEITIAVTVINRGDQPAKGTIDIDVHASPSNTAIPQGQPLARIIGKSINLLPGKAKVFKTSVVIASDAEPGNYYLLADVDARRAIGDADVGNNVVSTPESRAVAYKFGTFGSRKNVTLVLSNQDRTVTKVKLGGGGQGEMVFDSGGAATVLLTGTNAGSSVTFTVTGGRKQMDIGAVRGTTGSESLKSIAGKAINLVGEGVHLGGSLGSLTIRDIANGADVVTGGAASQKTTITARDIGDGTTIDTRSSIAGLTAARFGRGQVFAPRVTSLSIKGDSKARIPGDLSADVTATGQGLPAGTTLLGALSVAGTFRDGLVLVNGRAGTAKFSAVDAQGGSEFGIISSGLKSAKVATPAFSWQAKSGPDQFVGDFHVRLENTPRAWPLKGARWNLDIGGTTGTVSWTTPGGQSVLSPAVLGQAQIMVDPWSASGARVERMVADVGGEVFTSLPAIGLYWATVSPGQEGVFISTVAGKVMAATPVLVTSERALTIPTNWSEAENAVIPGLGNMTTGNVVVEGVGGPEDWSGDGDYVVMSSGLAGTDADGNFIETINAAIGATHTDIVDYYRTNGGRLYADNPSLTTANSIVAIPGNSTAADIVSLAAVIQRAHELRQPATINLSWGNGEYLPTAADRPAAWEAYNQSNTAVYLDSVQAILQSGVRGVGEAVIVQAAGNASTDLTATLVSGLTLQPTAASQVVQVGALDASGQIAAYSNYSTAAGTMLYVPVTGMTTGGVSIDGTSFAAPRIQYLVAQLREARPDLTPAQIRQVLFDPSVSPARPVQRPNAPVGETITIQAIENPYDEAVLQAALAVANAIKPPVATPGIRVTPISGLTTSESGQAASFTVSLRTQPTDFVTISLDSSDKTEGTVSRTLLSFTPDNWNVPQTVTVTGQDDLSVDGDVAYQVRLDPSFSLDATYNGLVPDSVNVVNQDNDVPEEPTDVQITYSGLVNLGDGTFRITYGGSATGPVGAVVQFRSNLFVTFDWALVASGWTRDTSWNDSATREANDDAETTFTVSFSFYAIPGEIYAGAEAWLSVDTAVRAWDTTGPIQCV